MRSAIIRYCKTRQDWGAILNANNKQQKDNHTPMEVDAVDGKGKQKGKHKGKDGKNNKGKDGKAKGKDKQNHKGKDAKGKQ
eukprot:3475512-Alexandrium_andersonii.AAC.1